MTDFGGAISLSVDQPLRPDLRRAVSRFGGNGPADIFADLNGSALIARRNAGTSAVTGAGFLFGADARLDNRAELGSLLSIGAPELRSVSDGELILHAYRRFGDAGIARCLGAFAFALWDERARRLVLGRDCLGNRALFFHHGGDFVVFATTLKALLTMPEVPRQIDERGLADLLTINLMDPCRTLYRGIERIPSRTLVTIERAGTSRRHYWSPNVDGPPPYPRDEDYVDRARELLDQAVAGAIADTPRVAISASGGLDSSAIAATAARLGHANSISCFCIVPPEGTRLEVAPGYYLDERDKVTALARMHPSLAVEFCVEGDLHPFEQDAARFFARSALPILNPTNLGPFSMVYERAAATGHPLILHGAAGNFGLSWTGQYSFLALMREGKFVTLARDFIQASRQGGRGMLSTFRGDILGPGVGPGVRRLLYRLYGRDPDDYAKHSVLNPSLISEMDLARRWRKEGFDPWFSYDGWKPVRHRAHFLFDHNQIARDSWAMFPEVRGLEVRQPLADRRLLEFLLAVPEPVYRRNGRSRSFARAVLADRLPREILDETRKGYQGATWFRRLDLRRSEISAEIERLEASPLASRLLDVPRLKRILDRWPRDENAAEQRRREVQSAFSRGIHVGRFIRWVEGGNA